MLNGHSNKMTPGATLEMATQMMDLQVIPVALARNMMLVMTMLLANLGASERQRGKPRPSQRRRSKKVQMPRQRLTRRIAVLPPL
jgi:hypothetical protein